MIIINKVQLTGNLGGNPEVRNFDNGNKMARFSMSTREDFTTRKGEKGSDVQWHYIIGWGKIAEKMETELRKGSFVSIEGRLPHAVMECHCTSFTFSPFLVV